MSYGHCDAWHLEQMRLRHEEGACRLHESSFSNPAAAPTQEQAQMQQPHKEKRVKYAKTCSLILIPTRQEYEDAGIELWYGRFSFEQAKLQASYEIKSLMLENPHMSFESAVARLYQPEGGVLGSIGKQQSAALSPPMRRAQTAEEDNCDEKAASLRSGSLDDAATERDSHSMDADDDEAQFMRDRSSDDDLSEEDEGQSNQHQQQQQQQQQQFPRRHETDARPSPSRSDSEAATSSEAGSDGSDGCDAMGQQLPGGGGIFRYPGSATKAISI